MTALIHLPGAVVRGELTPAGRRPGADTGDPQLRTLPVEAGTDAQVGIWECEPGGWPVVNRPNTETCYIISGRARLTDAKTGSTVEIAAGDFIVFSPGWTGRWDVVETIRKTYAIF